MIALYQADYQGHVPVMFNYHTGPAHNVNVGGVDTVPARTVLLSVALRNYGQRRRLTDVFNPQKMWPDDLKKKYESTLLPDYFMCPFIREKGDGWIYNGTVMVKGPISSRQYGLWQWDGRHESYHTWQWPNAIVRNKTPGGDIHPNAPKHGTPQYSALVWNKIKMANNDGYKFDDVRLPNAHRVWSASDARQLNSASLSDVTVLHCAQGMRIDLGYVYHNLGSHRRQVGGTNVTFADGHVGWVEGTRVGWP
jgi:prepilin-type processing-associated H-X9-DG protein